MLSERDAAPPRRRPMAAAALAGLAALLAAGAGGAASGKEPPADGAAIWRDDCALCHGPAGVPTPEFAERGAADLTSAAWQASRTDDQIRRLILEGKEDSLMPSFDGALTPAQLDALVAHIRRLAAKPPAGAPKKK